MTSESLQASRGTHDIWGTEIRLWQFLEQHARRILGQANYQEIRTPIFEATELFNRGIGEGTDIVSKEMYTFTDRGERSLTLRPEGTAGVVRSLIEHKRLQQGVQRCWYQGAMFRYERPQAGRQRQFHQLGVEVFGSDDPRSDVEVIALGLEFLEALGLSHLTLELNSVGDPEDRQRYKAALVDYLTPYASDLDPDSQVRLTKNPLRILDSKNPATQKILAEAPQLPEYLGQDSQRHFERVQSGLTALGLAYELNPRLVRGLDYYTRTAFEITTRELGAQSAVGGGGRYDQLVQELGGSATPAVGWAMGLERLVGLLQKRGETPAPDLDFYIATQGEGTANLSLQITQMLRRHGLRVEMDVSQSALGKQIKRADKLGCQACVIVGESEVATGDITVKWLATGVQELVAFPSGFSDSAVWRQKLRPNP
ncbi:histidyl-tRNA synthetase [Gloeomargarita lithophora Alchichica-D10]|uniref:Histidine--tRNA ligase n=1 Tax=Gloeomargarita lithophora Alchichica-D10 TaxID=1188229 RepID=A0A1J0AAC8_9CYAN|nr:histidine--tRNA ligase [Gloeomargarita lithophora]APB32882.1 histidyl-tRNA synthetase [Gloeomargarita lithophora Alchichica-D10]